MDLETWGESFGLVRIISYKCIGLQYSALQATAQLESEYVIYSSAVQCITLHYITLHYITLHYITLHYITLQ